MIYSVSYTVIASDVSKHDLLTPNVALNLIAYWYSNFEIGHLDDAFECNSIKRKRLIVCVK